ncbi:hypothetical protein FS842_011462 [Serendipita sp. 407]|nr:hypothetical protein FS842_011462 [Serendipita sp. 407]
MDATATINFFFSRLFRNERNEKPLGQKKTIWKQGRGNHDGLDEFYRQHLQPSPESLPAPCSTLSPLVDSRQTEYHSRFVCERNQKKPKSRHLPPPFGPPPLLILSHAPFGLMLYTTWS